MRVPLAADILRVCALARETKSASPGKVEANDMGWWKVQGSDVVVGDEVFSLMREAALSVVEEYQRGFARKPTRSEWELLLHDAMQPVENLESNSVEPLIEGETKAPRAVVIEVAEDGERQ